MDRLMDLKDFKVQDFSGRLPWDSYLMAFACLAAIRSPDPATKCGAVIVDRHHRILGVGYNCYPRGGLNDSLYPLTRPLKYATMIHSERNAIDNCQSRPEGGILYVTGPPCSHCMMGIIQAGIKRVIMGDIYAKCVDEDDRAASKLLIKNNDIEVIRYNGVSPTIVFGTVIDYLGEKSLTTGQAQSLENGIST